MGKIDFGKLKADIKKILIYIISALQKAWKKICSVRIKPADAAVLAGVIILSCLVIVPSIAKCADNRLRRDYSRHMSKMLDILSAEIEAETENGGGEWTDLIAAGNYEKLLDYITAKTGNGQKYPASDFYIQTGDNNLSIACRKHDGIREKTYRLPSAKSTVEIAPRPLLAAKPVYLSAGEGSVKAVYLGGYSEELEESAYTVNGSIVKYNSTSVWDSSAYSINREL